MDLLDRIRQHAETEPLRLVCSIKEHQMTYGELEQYSNGIAAYLTERFPEDRRPVVVYGHKHPLMIAAFLGCMKAGRAYCPVDVSLPADRVRSVIERTKTPVVLATEAGVEEAVPEGSSGKTASVVDLRELREITEGYTGLSVKEHRLSPDDIAYIIFTSGSTGRPKGVQIPYRCLCSFAAWSVTLGGSPEKKAGCRFLNQAPYSFDLSVMDLYTCLASGGTLYPLNKETQASYSELFRTLSGAAPQVWVSTPSFAELCLADPGFTGESFPELRIFLFCGERLTNATAQKLLNRFPEAKVVNTYGPTESTVAVTEVGITEELCARDENLPVGRPKPGCRIFIAEQGREAGEGRTGEIVISGDTLSAGYFEEPELTAASFRPLVLESGESVPAYYSGDEGYMRDGMLYFTGRIDRQVKLHGYRIELGDIENNLLRLPEIRQACVTTNEREGRVVSLTAVVCAGRVGDTRAAARRCREELKAYLPDYMIPKKFLFIDQMPMTPNGKADRRAVRELLKK